MATQAKAALAGQLAEVRRQLADLKAEEDRLLRLAKQQGWEDIVVEAGGAVAGVALGAAGQAMGLL